MNAPARRDPVAADSGDHLPSRVIGPITRTDIVRFAGAGGDFNPLHHDPEFATSAGFEDVIAMGQMQAGMLAGWLTDWCGVEHLVELETRFRRPVELGEILTFSGEVVAAEDGQVRLELRAMSSEHLAVEAWAVIRTR